jgi:PAS domain S-box-containing protein
MYHQHLARQIKKYLGENPHADEKLQQLLKAVSNSYVNYERDRELSEHAFSIHESEYQHVNERLQQLTTQLEKKVAERTKDLEEIAQFPLENPNPIFRVSLNGEVLFCNPNALSIKTIDFKNKKYSVESFFLKIIHQISESGSLEFSSDKTEYIFYYKKIENKNYINFYGADISEKNRLKEEAQENFKKLNNFLESTDDAYYIIYQKNKQKNYLTSKWQEFFGFGLEDCKDILSERKKCIAKDSIVSYNEALSSLAIGDQISISYQIKNKTNGKQYWLMESVSKQLDVTLNDIVVSGRITDITQQHLYSLEVKESEERFRTLVNSMPVMVWVSDEKNIVNYSNKALKDFLGFSMESLADNRDFIKYVHPDDHKIAIVEWRKKIDKRQSILVEYRLMDIKGNYHHILEQAVPRFYADGRFAGYIGSYMDLSKEKAYQKTLTVEKEKLEILTRNSPDIILLTDNEGVIEYVSPTAQRILGYSESEMVDKNVHDFLCEECKQHLKQLSWLNKVNKKDKFEYRMVKKNGDLLWVESALSIIKNHSDKGNKILMHNRDIQSIKEAEEILLESEQKYRGLFENMYLGVMEVDLNENIQWVNKSFEMLTGYSLKYLKGKNAYNLFLANNPASKKIMQQVHKSRSKKNDSIYEVKMSNKKGDLMDVVISGSPVIDRNGKVKGSVGIHWDVTDIRKMEQVIEEEKLSRQKDIMQATLNAEEQQREILGNELHDGVGHILTYTSLFLQMASNANSYNADLYNKAQGKVSEALNEVRRISRSLMPPALIDLGLKEAIIELFNQYADINALAFNFECKSKDFEDVDINAQRNIYRIIQELLSNTIKHAAAKKVTLLIKRSQDQLNINYVNDGISFNIKKIKKGIGIKSITNRTYFYSGTSQIKSSKGKGSEFIIELPLKNILNNE